MATPKSHPRVRPWRERFRALGVSPREFPSSIEGLMRRALKGGPLLINPLVDLYNALSLRHVVPAGGFDLAALRKHLELRLTREGDTFHALDGDEPVAVPSGEVAYADGLTILTRHFVWRQARTGLIGPRTRDVILLGEVLPELEEGVAEAVQTDLQAELKRHFRPASLTVTILDVESPWVAW